MGMLKEFKEFAMKGNVMDLAVAVIIGAAFGKIVTSLVEDIIMPIIGLATGGVSFTDKFYALDGKSYATLEVDCIFQNTLHTSAGKRPKALLLLNPWDCVSNVFPGPRCALVIF